MTESESFNTLRPRQNGRHFVDDTFKRIFVNENVKISINISLKFVPKGLINNIPALVQIMDHYLNQWWLIYWRHICVTRPQWINDLTHRKNQSTVGHEWICTWRWGSRGRIIIVGLFQIYGEDTSSNAGFLKKLLACLREACSVAKQPDGFSTRLVLNEKQYTKSLWSSIEKYPLTICGSHVQNNGSYETSVKTSRWYVWRWSR